ncbi:MAG TPA: protein kinase [Kofleriaceae bacterium]|nr:protein kinase [Kofleriaceae bacterium]
MGSAEEFGPYVVYEQIGLGGMATVHRAETQGIAGFSKQVALKRMLPSVAADANLVKSFIREARLASHLRHANVAQTYDLGKVGETYFIAMELVPGRNLREILKHCLAKKKPMPLQIAMNIVNQICDALDYAHNLCDESGKPLGIIHRDVSPANVILGESGIVKLIDFGIAKASSGGMQTMSGTIKGKFAYMAPEYLMGHIDARADLFALGVIAHELLANKPLFQGRDDMDTLYRVKDMPIIPPSHFNPNVPPEIDSIIMTALERDPDKRWQQATALRTALTTETKRLGLVAHNAEVEEWLERAFVNREDSSPEISMSGGGTMELSKGSVPKDFLQQAQESMSTIVTPKGSQPQQAFDEADWNAESAVMTNPARPSQPAMPAAVPREFLQDQAATSLDRPSQQMKAQRISQPVPVQRAESPSGRTPAPVKTERASQPYRAESPRPGAAGRATPNVLRRGGDADHGGFTEEQPTRADALAVDSLAASKLARREDSFGNADAFSEKTMAGLPSEEAMALLQGGGDAARTTPKMRADSFTDVDIKRGPGSLSDSDAMAAILDSVPTFDERPKTNPSRTSGIREVPTMDDMPQLSARKSAIRDIPNLDDIEVPSHRKTPPPQFEPRKTPPPQMIAEPRKTPPPQMIAEPRRTPPAMRAQQAPQHVPSGARTKPQAIIAQPPPTAAQSGARTHPRMPPADDDVGDVLDSLDAASRVETNPLQDKKASAKAAMPMAPRSVASNFLLMLLVLLLAGGAAAVVYFALPYFT